MKPEAKVGLFVVVGMVLLFVLATQVNRFQGLGQEGYTIEALIKDANGLQKHAKVKMHGVHIGYVRNIGLVDGRVKLTLFIKKGVLIPKDSSLLLRQESMLSGKFLDIFPGQSSEPLLPHMTIDKEHHTVSFEEMGERVALAADELKGFIHTLRQTFDAQSRDHLRQTFSNLEVLTRDLKALIAANRSRIDQMVGDIDKAAQDFSTMSQRFTQTAQTINMRLPHLLGELDKTIAAYKGAGQTLDRWLPILAKKFETVEDQLQNVIQDNSQPLHKALGSVDRFFSKGEHTIAKLDGYIDAMTQSRLEMGMDAIYLVNDGQFQGKVSLDYAPTYSRHYLLDIVSSPDYSKKDAQGHFIADLDHADSKWYISAQIAKRYRSLRIRGGLIESTAGVGIDWYGDYDKLRLSLDAFDMGSVNDLRANDAHLRTTLRYRFYKHINAYVGYDNFLNTKADNLFFGVGVWFEDDQLKYMLGTGLSAGAAAK